MEEFYLDTKVDISVVVPVFNAERSLNELCDRLKKTLEALEISFEVIFVDDYSKDKSWIIIQQLKRQYPDLIKGIRLSRNYGQHNATLCGISHSKGDFIVTIDDDLEFSPEDIALLIIEQERTDSDLVYGVGENKKVSFVRKITKFFYKKLAQIYEGEDRIKGSSFRLMKESLGKTIVKHRRFFSFIDEFVVWNTSNLSAITVRCNSQGYRKSNYSTFNLSILTKDLILLSSIAHLRVATFIGTFMVFFNFIAGVIILYRKFILSIKVEGYTSMIVAVLFSSGVIIFTLGVIAEHISKLIKISYNKPAYREAEVI
jgi:glycosyltransferase involved in cell wall biosynthesis